MRICIIKPRAHSPTPIQYIPEDRRDRGNLSRVRLCYFCGLLLLLLLLLTLGALLRVLDNARTRDLGAGAFGGLFDRLGLLFADMRAEFTRSVLPGQAEDPALIEAAFAALLIEAAGKKPTRRKFKPL